MEKQKCRKSQLQTIKTLENARQKIITLENTENQKLWRAERRNYGAYRPVLLFKSSCWKKEQIRKLVYSTKEWRFRHMTHQLGTKNYLWRKPYLFSPLLSVSEKSTHNGSRLATNCFNVICVRDREKWIMTQKIFTWLLLWQFYCKRSGGGQLYFAK